MGKDDDEEVKKRALEIMGGSFQVLPRLVVFDLDFTLWPFYCHLLPKEETPTMYPDAKGILLALKDKGLDLAIASKSIRPDKAELFLKNLGITYMFVDKEIYPSWTHKTDHFNRIKNKTGVPFNAMLFFDDEDPNIQAVSNMGVTSILVNDGVTLEAFEKGLTEFSKK